MRTLNKMIRAALRTLSKRKAAGHTQTVKRGKQTVKELAKQNRGMSNIEITKDNIKGFERYAKKFGVDFALKKGGSKEPPT